MKMKKLLLALLAALVPLAAPAPGQAEVLLSLSSPADVNHLTVGQSVTFNVDLSGLDPQDPGTYLSFLDATVQYDNILLSPSTVMVGSIVPDATNFTGTGLSNKADGLYDGVFAASPSDPISTNGTFFSFTATTLAAGDGTITFESDAATLAVDPTQTTQFNPDTRSLSFHIEAGAVAVPEPGVLTRLLSGALAGGIALAWRRLGRRLRASGPARDTTAH